MKVVMLPSTKDFSHGNESGIRRVVEAYQRYLPAFGVEFVDPDSTTYDVKAVHAGMTAADCTVAHLHGLYFTADYPASKWEYRSNANIVAAIRNAREITVPSRWVAEAFERDYRMSPHVVPHGIEAEDWKHNEPDGEYVLWNKNRDKDVCDISPLSELARAFPDISFLSTIDPATALPNIQVTGIRAHEEMKRLVQRCRVYLSTTKETFGIGILEAMASGKPVLGFNYGGNAVLVQHKVTGYLAEPGNYDDLAFGLAYCLTNRKKLGRNAGVMAREWTWEKAVEIVYGIYVKSMEPEQEPSVSVIIPIYNYKDKVAEAIDSCLSQTLLPKEIILVDDGSTDGLNVTQLSEQYQESRVRIIAMSQKNAGVAVARNNGILRSSSKYICCLDADDKIAPDFLRVCVEALEGDRTLGIAYTRLLAQSNGNDMVSQWPGDYHYDGFLARKNQVPTCCVFRRQMFDRLGGYRQRYAPQGAGAEDAEFWMRAGAYGYRGELVSQEPLFLYSLRSGNTSKPGYREVDWLAWHPWARDGQHPFMSLATPEFLSHKVREYDEPMVSVVIPVGEGHEEKIINALDSLEAQTDRSWEVVVAWDSPNPVPDLILNAYPYMRLVYTKRHHSGAGAARNLGADNARGRFLVFLDADDWLYPNALQLFRERYAVEKGIVYSDYVGKSFVSEKDLEQFRDRLLDYDPKTGEAVMSHRSAEYDCLRAQEQPDMRGRNFFHWCLVTCLIPTEWHKAIGGFDETMPSWEDVDYHWRMAQSGYCYFRIPQPLIVYNFSTGNRREVGSENFEKLLGYLSDKYRSVKMSPCRTCGGGYHPELPVTQQEMTGTSFDIKDEDTVMIMYKSLNIGEHMVVGPVTGIKYGYRSQGSVFLIHRADAASSPHLFEPVQKKPTEQSEHTAEEVEAVTKPDTTIPTLSSEAVEEEQVAEPEEEKDDVNVYAEDESIDDDDFDSKPVQPTVVPQTQRSPIPMQTSSSLTVEDEISYLNSLSFGIIRDLKKQNVHTIRQLIDFGRERFLLLHGVGPARWGAVLEELKRKGILERQDED